MSRFVSSQLLLGHARLAAELAGELKRSRTIKLRCISQVILAVGANENGKTCLEHAARFR